MDSKALFLKILSNQNLLLGIRSLSALAAQLPYIQIVLFPSKLELHTEIFFLHEFWRILLQLFCQFRIVIEQGSANRKQLVFDFIKIIFCL